MSKLKNILKAAMSKARGRTINQLDVDTPFVSFDIFDTLVTRNVEKPTDVFRWIDRENAGFYEARVQAEKVARENAHHEDITIDEIYLQIEEKNGHEEATRLKALELSTELQMCVPNREVVQLYNALLAEGRTILLVSDMYLPSGFISEMLERCGICGYKKLYVSGDVGLSKRSGHLFDAVMRENRITPNQLTHIGDHPISDYHMPKKRGIKAFLYKRTQYPLYYLPDFCARKGYDITSEMAKDYDILRCVCRNSALESDLSYLLGNQVLGPMLYGFSCWLHRRVKENNIKDIVFLAREGRLLRDCYTTMYGNGDENIAYINVSRLSVCRALIINTHSFDELIDMMKSLLRGMKLLKEFIVLLGIGEQLESIYYDTGYDDATKIDEVDKDNLYQVIMKYGMLYFRNQNKYVKQYLLEKGINSKKVFLVDIGWAGTMQLKITELDPATYYIGNYLCVNNMHINIPQYKELDRHGYWCDPDGWDTRGKVFRFSMSAIEELFMTGEGTTLEYRLIDGEIEPVQDLQSQNIEISDKIKTMHKGLFDFISFNRSYDWDFNSYVYMFPYINFAIYPTLHCVKALRGFSFVNGVHKISVLPDHSTAFYFMHPMHVKKDLEENMNKVLWLKALLKVPFPYFEFLCLLSDKLGVRSEYSKKYVKNDKA